MEKGRGGERNRRGREGTPLVLAYTSPDTKSCKTLCRYICDFLLTAAAACSQVELNDFDIYATSSCVIIQTFNKWFVLAHSAVYRVAPIEKKLTGAPSFSLA